MVWLLQLPTISFYFSYKDILQVFAYAFESAANFVEGDIVKGCVLNMCCRVGKYPGGIFVLIGPFD
jgi:hypothetical protein